MICRVMTAAVLSVAVISFCWADQQARPRFPVELEVFAANAGVLLDPTISVAYKQGLRLRMAGALGYMRFLTREYHQTFARSDKNLLTDVAQLRRLFKQAKWQTLARQSKMLAKRYPLKLARLDPDKADAQAIASGRHIYRHLCLGCHEHPDKTQAVPASDLFAMAKTKPVRELMARLIAGVHGTPAVALRNPFSDRELAGLAAYLKQATPEQN